MPREKRTVQKNKSFQDYIRKFNELSTVFDSMPTGVFAILDRKLNIATINKTAREILGSDSQLFIGKNTREVFEDRFPGIQKLIDETIQNHRGIKNFNLEIEDRNSNIKTYLVSTAITEELDSADIGIILVLYDISEVTRLRKAA